MKPFGIANLLVVATALALTGAGCKHVQKPVTPLQGSRGAPVPGPNLAGPVKPGPVTPVAPVAPVTSVTPTNGVTKITTNPPDVGGGQPVKPDDGTRTTPIVQNPTPPSAAPKETILTTPPGETPQPSIDLLENMVPDEGYFAGQTVYFDFDSAVVRKTQQGRADAVGDELKAKPECKLMVDGHCDERGTEEYNRALGERRALAVREYLLKFGIGPDRIFTRTWGENRPAVDAHNEDAWSKNRRAEFILLNPKQ